MDLRALLASPLGLLIGLSLGALGGGGSILAVPALVLGAGQSPREATTSSLVLVGGTALVGLRRHLAKGRVEVGTGLAFGAAGIPGSLLGTALHHRLDPDVLLLGFSVLVLLAAHRMLTGCPTCTAVGERRALVGGVATRQRVDTSRVVAVAGAGTAVGLLTGLFGVGGGFVIVPALALLLHLPMPSAIGTSVLVIAVNAAVALVPRLGGSTIEWAVTVPFAVAALIGVLVGGRVADRLDAQRSLRWFAGVLVLVAVTTGVAAALAL